VNVIAVIRQGNLDGHTIMELTVIKRVLVIQMRYVVVIMPIRFSMLILQPRQPQQPLLQQLLL